MTVYWACSIDGFTPLHVVYASAHHVWLKDGTMRRRNANDTWIRPTKQAAQAAMIADLSERHDEARRRLEKAQALPIVDRRERAHA